MTDTCDILPPQRMDPDPKFMGCPLPLGHAGRHHALLRRYGQVEWEADANCDCSDCRSEEPDDRCVIWKQL